MNNKFVAGTFNALRFARVNARKTIVLKQYISKKYCLVKKKALNLLVWVRERAPTRLAVGFNDEWNKIKRSKQSSI